MRHFRVLCVYLKSLSAFVKWWDHMNEVRGLHSSISLLCNIKLPIYIISYRGMFMTFFQTYSYILSDIKLQNLLFFDSSTSFLDYTNNLVHWMHGGVLTNPFSKMFLRSGRWLWSRSLMERMSLRWTKACRYSAFMSFLSHFMSGSRINPESRQVSSKIIRSASVSLFKML